MKSEKDLLLLSLLRQNSRETLTELSRKTGIPISTIHKKIREFSENNVLRYTSLLDFDKIGHSIRTNIVLKTIKKDKNALMEHLSKHPNTNTLSRVDDHYDLMFEGVFKDLKQMHEFIDELEDKFSIRKKHVFHIVEDVKKEGFLAKE